VGAEKSRAHPKIFFPAHPCLRGYKLTRLSLTKKVFLELSAIAFEAQISHIMTSFWQQ
jgi:hypothetical protein